MGNNAPDYENLAFAPTSADDLGEQKRDSDVLIKAIEKCEKLEKQLKIAVETLSWYNGLECMLIDWELATGQKKGAAKQALEQIKELDK